MSVETRAPHRQCPAWIADEWGSAACPLHGVYGLHEGPHDQRPDQIAAWYDTDPGAHPALPTAPVEVCS